MLSYGCKIENGPQWRNWQTRYVQDVVGISSWGFKSLLRHQAGLQEWSPVSFSQTSARCGAVGSQTGRKPHDATCGQVGGVVAFSGGLLPSKWQMLLVAPRALCYTGAMATGNDPSSGSRQPRPLISRLGLLLLIGLCVLFVSSYTSRLLRKAQVEQRISEWEQRIAAAELRQLQLQAELEYVNSPAYLEQVARNDLDMARDGDTVIIVVAGTVTPSGAGSLEDGMTEGTGAPVRLPGEPTWKQWITILAGEE